MAVVNNTVPAQADNSGMGFFMAMIMFFILLILLFYYGLPMLRGAISTPSAPQIQVPGKVDVNVHNK